MQVKLYNNIWDIYNDSNKIYDNLNKNYDNDKITRRIAKGSLK